MTVHDHVDLGALLGDLRTAFHEADGGPAALVVRRGDQALLAEAAGDDRRGRPMTTDRPVFLYSAIKPVAALAVLVAVADGAVALDDRVAAHWPAFAACGKGAVTIRQALAHAAAVPGWRPPLGAADLADLPAAQAALAASAPWWPVGEPGEHAISYGHLLDGILRHATGEGIEPWADRAVAATGTGVSLRPGQGDRDPAPLEDPGGVWAAATAQREGLMGELLRAPAEVVDVRWLDGPAGRSLLAPAITGYGSAADLAGLWAWWTGPGAVARLGQALRDASLQPQASGHDHVLGRDVSWGLGPQVDAVEVGMGGVGGSAGWHHRPTGLSLGLTVLRVDRQARFDLIDEALARWVSAAGG